MLLDAVVPGSCCLVDVVGSAEMEGEPPNGHCHLSRMMCSSI